MAKNDSLAKFSAKGWTCDACLVSNKDDADKCIACTTARPGTKKSKYTFCFQNFVHREKKLGDMPVGVVLWNHFDSWGTNFRG